MMGMDTGDPCKWGPAPRNTSAPTIAKDEDIDSGSSPYVPADMQPYIHDIVDVVGKAKKAVTGDTTPQVCPPPRKIPYPLTAVPIG